MLKVESYGTSWAFMRFTHPPPTPPAGRGVDQHPLSPQSSQPSLALEQLGDENDPTGSAAHEVVTEGDEFIV